jgi:hypothetical protein
MSRFVLDDQLDVVDVCHHIRRWATAEFVRDSRPGEVIKDERIPDILRTLRTPSFVTIDHRFRDRALRDRRYCILYFDIRADEQGNIPALPRQLLRLPAFRTRAAHMGKVARVSRDHVSWWDLGDEHLHTVHWSTHRRGRPSR